jgi:hypothetical protein
MRYLYIKIILTDLQCNEADCKVGENSPSNRKSQLRGYGVDGVGCSFGFTLVPSLGEF